MDPESRLSRIETLWSVVRRAHDDAGSDTAKAQQALLDQYGGAVRRYLLASLRDQDAADEVFQDFAVKFVRGDFKRADPEKGRFRQFVKTVIYRMVVDYHRVQNRTRHQGLMDAEQVVEPLNAETLDQQFIDSWRSELLARTWASLKAAEAESHKPYYTVLRLRVDKPGMRSADVAVELSQILGREIKAGNARVLVHRSRELFALKLVELVEQSLDEASEDDLENELITLDLLEYCKPVLESRRG